jgi:hypothetical protein
MAAEPELNSRPVALKISRWNRAALDVLGIAGLGAGGAAVFITHLEAGPVALLVVGMVLLLVGMSGRMPTRLKVGDNEAAWEVEREAVQAFVERVAEDATIESQPELLDALGELAEGAPRVAAAGIGATAYENLVRSIIAEALYDEGGSGHHPIKLTTQITNDRGEIDAILEGPTGRLVAIEIKNSTKAVSAESIARMYHKLFNDSRAWRGPGVMLLVTRTRLTHSAELELKKYANIHHVTFAGPQDREVLINAVREAAM